MINRFKLLLLLIILAVLGVLFVQNQQPLSLKLLCPDTNSSCLYQTPQLPLAVWMGLFILMGTFTSLLWQLLNRFSYSSAKKKSYSSDVLYDREADLTTKRSRENTRYTTVAESRKSNVSESSVSDWENSRKSEDCQPQQPLESTVENSNPTSQTSTSSEYEIRREPENVTLSGTTYSYKFKEASDRESKQSNTPNLNKQSNLDDDDDEEWI